MASDRVETAFLEALIEPFKRFESVRAIALAGSRSTGVTDDLSDIDLYVYRDGFLPLEARTRIVRNRSDRFEIGNSAFEDGDEWFDDPGGVAVDVIYRDPNWIEGVFRDLFEHHRAQIGYSTCLLHNVRTSQLLYDPAGWFAGLQERARQPLS